MSFETFLAGLTAVWEHDANIFWEMHNVVRDVNPQWQPAEGNG
jgi:hypothetical protein